MFGEKLLGWFRSLFSTTEPVPVVVPPPDNLANRLTSETLVKLGVAGMTARTWIFPIRLAMDEFHLDTVPRLAAFLAQILYESRYFIEIEENLNYSAIRLLQVFPGFMHNPDGTESSEHYFTPVQADEYQHHPKMIGNRVYANRMGNGDEASGDGYNHRGMGPLQLTGLDNHRACGAFLGLDLVNHPELLIQPGPGIRSAGWFWTLKRLNTCADALDIDGITRIINGGTNGADDRRILYHKCLEVLA